jgi:hypothetical protein
MDELLLRELHVSHVLALAQHPIGQRHAGVLLLLDAGHAAKLHDEP